MSTDRVHSILSISTSVESEEERDGLKRIVDAILNENPAYKIKAMPSEQFILSGEDELELEEVCKQIEELRTIVFGELKIEYRETIRKHTEAEGKYIRQTGGSGNYGHCWLHIEPNEPGRGYKFIDEIRDGRIPFQFIEPIDQGVQGALELGILAGYPIVDVKVTLFDGSYHDVDSNEMAFKFAGSIAFKEAARKASPALLEPMMAIEVTVPEEFMGTIIGDINARRGRIDEIENEDESGSLQTIKARVPLPELLRSSAYGRPEWAMRFAGYQEKPRFDRLDGDDATAPAIKPRTPKPQGGSATAGF